MTEESSVSIDDVRTLVAERLRFDEWISALEDRRDDTPEHVFERVHGDYVSRRTDVMTQLHAHVPALESLLSELDARAGSLAERAQAEEDEKAEAMLRHAVGEYDDAKWDEVRKRVEANLATLGGERDALDEQRADVGSLLESARPEPEPEPEPVAGAVAEVPVDGSADGVRPESGAPDASAVARLDAPIDEEETTAEWLGITPAEGAAAVGDSETADSDAATSQSDRERADGRDGDPEAGRQDEADAEARLEEVESIELTSGDSAPAPTAPPERRRSIWGTDRTGGSGSSPSPSDTDSDDVFGDARPSRPTAKDGEPASSGKDASSPRDGGAREGGESFDELAFLRSVIDPSANSPMTPRSPSSEAAQKTLRCTECGTMNLPTEWYCERCGGELAAF